MKNFRYITFSVIGVKPDKAECPGEDIQKNKMVLWGMVKRYEIFTSFCFLSVFKSKVIQKLKVSRKAQEVSSKKPIQTIRKKKTQKLIDMNYCMLPLSGSRRVFQTSIICKRNILDPAKAGVFCFFDINETNMPLIRWPIPMHQTFSGNLLNVQYICRVLIASTNCL